MPGAENARTAVELQLAITVNSPGCHPPSDMPLPQLKDLGAGCFQCPRSPPLGESMPAGGGVPNLKITPNGCRATLFLLHAMTCRLKPSDLPHCMACTAVRPSLLRGTLTFPSTYVPAGLPVGSLGVGGGRSKEEVSPRRPMHQNTTSRFACTCTCGRGGGTWHALHACMHAPVCERTMDGSAGHSFRRACAHACASLWPGGTPSTPSPSWSSSSWVDARPPASWSHSSQSS